MFNARTPLATAFAVVLTTSALTAPSALAKPPGGGGSGGGGTSATSYSGSATVVKAKVGLLGVLLPKLVDLELSDVSIPSTGGFQHDHLVRIGVQGPPLWLDAHVASATSAAAGDRSHSSASVADVFLGLGALTPDTLSIRAGVLRSSALAKCGTSGPEVSGGANIVDLTITASGTPYTFNLAAPANTKVEIPGVARITINEQIKTANSITVNALHVETLSPLDAVVDADVVISRAHADINCQGGENPPPPPPCQVLDFVTGGGQINGKNSSFGMVGGQKPNGLSGHFNLVNKTTGDHLQGTDVTDYQVVNTTTRKITYSGTINGSPATIVVTVTDNGEPGTSDLITVSPGGYGPTTIKGNIQLHKPNGCGGSSKGGGRR